MKKSTSAQRSPIKKSILLMCLIPCYGFIKFHLLIHITMIHIKWLPIPPLLKDPTGTQLLCSILNHHPFCQTHGTQSRTEYFFLNQFVQVKIYHKAVVLKVWVGDSETLRGSLRSFQISEIYSEGPWSQTYFYNNAKILLSFSFSVSHGYSLEFPKVYMTGDNIIALMAS